MKPGLLPIRGAAQCPFCLGGGGMAGDQTKRQHTLKTQIQADLPALPPCLTLEMCRGGGRERGLSPINIVPPCMGEFNKSKLGVRAIWRNHSKRPANCLMDNAFNLAVRLETLINEGELAKEGFLADSWVGGCVQKKKPES